MTTNRLLIACAGAILIGIGINAYTVVHNNHRVSQIITQSRREGCEVAERLREGVREDVVREERELPKTLRLLHIADTGEVRKLAEANWARQRARALHVDCPAYARRALH